MLLQVERLAGKPLGGSSVEKKQGEEQQNDEQMGPPFTRARSVEPRDHWDLILVAMALVGSRRGASKLRAGCRITEGKLDGNCMETLSNITIGVCMHAFMIRCRSQQQQ